MEAFEAAKARLEPRRYLEVRYEDFVASPAESLRAMVDFIGLQWSRRLERAIAHGQFDGSRRNAFERDLRPEQVAELERLLGPILERYGYT